VTEGLVGNVRNKTTQKRGRPSSKDVEDHLNDKLHLIQVNDGKVKKNCAACYNREAKGGRRETSFYCDVSKEAKTPTQQVFCHISYSEEVPFGMYLIEIFYI
jgi:hypothetical protein